MACSFVRFDFKSIILSKSKILENLKEKNVFLSGCVYKGVL